ncbi:MAG: hypothetical protein IKN98_06140 [Bacteroidales bacterium]|nr:hypothetical protein [Bacteroidales bacterium]
MIYWIIVDSWNLMESMTTESLSPYSFYQQRGFGSNLSRRAHVGNEKINALVLSAKKPQGQYTIWISDSIVDTSLLRKVGNGIFTYPRTIYFSKGNAGVCFADDNLLKGFVAEANILFEVKCVEKYKDSFFVDSQYDLILNEESSDEISFDAPIYIEYDRKVNTVKGGVIGYLRGLATSTDFNQQQLLNRLNDTKNCFAGLCTSLLMQEDNFDMNNYVSQVDQAKSVWINTMPSTNLFEIVTQLLGEIKKTVDLRESDAEHRRSPEYQKHISQLEKEKKALEESIERMEERFGIADCRRELQAIKNKESENGQKQGKTREYFKKGTPEYARKQQLKETLSDFQTYNSEYRDAISKIHAIKDQLDELTGESGKYDGAIRSLFIQISDICNTLISKVNTTPRNLEIHTSGLSYNNGLSFNGCVASATPAEICLYNIMLQYVQANSVPAGQKVSTEDIIQLIEKTANIFKKSEYAQTDNGIKLLKISRKYYAYKTGKAIDFEEPTDLPIMQAMMAFIIKAQGFDQIERYMLHRHYGHKELAFMLWGAYVGYAAIPKTFTNPIYQNAALTTLCEKEGAHILKSIGNLNK